MTLILTLQSIGPDGTTPSDAVAASRAVDCIGFLPELPNPGGPRWELHLRVPAASLADATSAREALGASELRTAADAAFSIAPDGPEGTPAEPIPC